MWSPTVRTCAASSTDRPWGVLGWDVVSACDARLSSLQNSTVSCARFASGAKLFHKDHGHVRRIAAVSSELSGLYLLGRNATAAHGSPPPYHGSTGLWWAVFSPHNPPAQVIDTSQGEILRDSPTVRPSALSNHAVHGSSTLTPEALPKVAKVPPLSIRPTMVDISKLGPSVLRTLLHSRLRSKPLKLAARLDEAQAEVEARMEQVHPGPDCDERGHFRLPSIQHA